MFVSAFNPDVRNAVIPTDDQTAREAAEMAGLAPRDGSAWEVYDALGDIVADRAATELVGQSLYVGPPAIAAGSVSVSSISKVRSDFPSIKAVSGFKREDTIDMLHLKIGDSRGRTVEGEYECVIDHRGHSPIAHVLNLRTGIKHPRLLESKIPGTNRRPT